jgi:hypothetical protein
MAKQLSDRELIAQVKALAQREREATAALVAHLAVMLERRLYLGQGFSSMHTYCRRVLHMSEYAAYARVEAARAALKYPLILERLAEGSVNLTTVGLLIPELTPGNHRRLLDGARYKSKREVQELIACLRPQPPVPSIVRKLPTAATQSAQSTAPSANMPGQSVPFTLSTSVRPPARPVVVPLAPDRYKVQFTASAEGYANLKMAQDFLRHQIPNGDEGKIIELALARLVKDLKKEKLGAADRPRASRGTAPDSRDIPAAVRREVWARDGGQCAFVGQNGRRCEEKGFLEFHHVQPYAAKGKATVDNIELRCAAHNQYEAGVCPGAVSVEPEFKTVHRLGL